MKMMLKAYSRTAIARAGAGRGVRGFAAHRLALLLLLTAAGIAPAWVPVVQAETRYVSDDLTIPLRTGASNQYRIIRFITSGTRLETHESSDDGSYSRVTLQDGTEGWVLNENLMNQPSARDRLVAVQRRLDQSAEAQQQLRKTIGELEAANKALEQSLSDTRRDLGSLETEHEDLKRLTSNPRALANENNVLKERLNTLTASQEQLQKEYNALQHNETREWFIIGASVSMGSLLFGLLITRIRWRRKRSWGDDF